MILDELIVFSCAKDALTWKFSGPRLLKRIQAYRYTLVVPDRDLALFQAISPKAFHTQAESFYSPSIYEDIYKRLPDHKKDMASWYSQQFIKFYAIYKSDPALKIALWDGDTVPLKPITFINAQGQLNYFTGQEQHMPYFKTIKILLGLNKISNDSFIAQCFPLKVQWFHHFIDVIEKRSGNHWAKSILDSIDFSHNNAFSEYETLGTFITHHYPKDINLLSTPWYRLGNSLIGDVRLIDSKHAKARLANYHYVSFEKWDKPKPFFFRSTLPIFIETQLKPPFRTITKKQLLKHFFTQFQQSKGILKINTGVGIFSCCTMRLEEILRYFNTYHSTPIMVDSQEQFGFYKDGLDLDISQDLFTTRNDLHIPWIGKSISITDSLDEQQFSNYRDLNFKEITPFIEKYFSPSQFVLEKMAYLKITNQIDLNNTCVIRFRGTDKQAETVQPSFEEVLKKALALKIQNPTLRFAIQTDDPDFRSFIFGALGNDSFTIEQMPWSGWDGSKDCIDFYASMLLCSQCRYIITTSGNGELWMMLFRGHANGVYQYLQHKEFVYGQPNPSFRPLHTSFWLDSY